MVFGLHAVATIHNVLMCVGMMHDNAHDRFSFYPVPMVFWSDFPTFIKFECEIFIDIAPNFQHVRLAYLYRTL